MPTNITDADTFDVAQHIADGDALNGPSFENEVQRLANRSNFVRNRVAAALGGNKMVPLAACGATQLTFSEPAFGTTDVPRWRNATTTKGSVTFQSPPEFGGAIAGFVAYLQGASGLGSLPSTLPRVLAWEVDITTGVLTTIGGQVDTSATLAAYKLVHAVSYEFTARDVDPTKALYVSVEDDDGTTAGFNLFGAYAIVSTT